MQEVALQHRASGLVAHNAFREVPITKILKGIKATVGAGTAVAEALKGTGPKDALTLIKVAVKGAGILGNDVMASASQLNTILETAAQQLPNVGKLVTQSIMSSVASGVGKQALKCTSGCMTLPLSSQTRAHIPTFPHGLLDAVHCSSVCSLPCLL